MTINKIYDSFGFLFSKAAIQIRQALDPELARWGLKYNEMGMLLIISEEPGMSQKEAGAIQGTDRSTVTEILDKLEEEGLAVRKTNPQDRRSYILSLTPKGEDLTNHLYQTIQEVQASYMETLAPDQVKTLQKILIQMTSRGGDLDD